MLSWCSCSGNEGTLTVSESVFFSGYAQKCKPSAHCACVVLLIDGLHYAARQAAACLVHTTAKKTFRNIRLGHKTEFLTSF